MLTTEYGKKLEIGDKICCQGYAIVINNLIYQDYDRYHDSFIAEFEDRYGDLHSWHQSIDGGHVEPKAN